MLAHLLLVDDDPLFCQLMQIAALRLDFQITICHSGRELSTLPDIRLFDVAIVDHFFGDLAGEDIAPYFSEIPVILISANRSILKDSPQWPSCIKYFVDKASGIPTILKAAYETSRTFRNPIQPM